MKKVGTFCWRRNEGVRGYISDRNLVNSLAEKSFCTFLV